MSNSNIRRTHRSTSSTNRSALSKPTSFRIIYKTRSGFLDDPNLTQRQVPMSIPNRNNTHTVQSQFSDADEKLGIEDLGSTSQMNLHLHNVGLTQNIAEVESGCKTENLPRIDRNVFTLPNQIQEEENLSDLSIDEIEKKIDTLIEMKLVRVAERGTTTEINTVTDEIDQKINKIVEYLQREQTGAQNLKLTNRKIEILEKIMAESAIEAELAKKNYFSKNINNRKTKAPKVSKYRTNIIQLKQLTRKLMHRNPPTSIQIGSTSHMNYLPPNKNAYPTAKPKPKFIFDTQPLPLPRSSYDRDYIAYGSLPKHIYKQQQSISVPYSLGKQCSSYNDSFTVKKMEKVDFKDLDCYRDKLKNLKIPFIDNKAYQISLQQADMFAHSNPEDMQSQTCKIKDTQRERERENDTQRERETNRSLVVQQMKTQNREKFKGELNEFESGIKHKKLNNLKYAYKAVVHA